MKYSVDRIEESIVVIENLETKEIFEIDKKNLPSNIKDGTILIYQDNEYKLDINEEELRRKRIEEKFKMLRNKDV